MTPLLNASGNGHRELVELLIANGADVNTRYWNGTPLLAAAAAGHTDVVKLLIAKGADVNASDNRGRTPLSLAKHGKHAEVINILRQHGAKESLHNVMAAGDIDQVKRLISEGADVDAKDGKGQTPLHLAVLAGRKDIVELLIANGADINVKSNTWDTTPLIAALRSGHEDIAKMLIAKGADVNARALGDYTALHWTACNRTRMTGATDIMKLLLAKDADIEARQEHDATPLACATYDGNTESTKFLIEHGANIEAKLNDGETTPLLRAVSQQYVETAKLLLDKGANIHATWRGLSAVHVAMLGDRLSNRKSDKEMVSLLVEKGLESPPIHLAAFFGDLQKLKSCLNDGTKIDEQDTAGFTPLHCAVSGDHTDVVEFLLRNGANVNAKTMNGWTPLAFVWPVDMAALLIANGADVRIASKFGTTVLHGAVNRDNHRGDMALTELLLKHGADINAKAGSTSVGWEGWTPLHVACRNGAQDIVELLLAHGADVNAKSDKGETPLSIAQNNGHRQVVELLKEHGAKE
jgi:ankyrin repeat protein